MPSILKIHHHSLLGCDGVIRLLPVGTVVFFLLVHHFWIFYIFIVIADVKGACGEYLALNSNVDSSDNRCLICLLHIFFYFKLYIVYMYTFH